MSSDDCTTKQCTRCHEYFPKTTEYFNWVKPKKRNGYFFSKCRNCEIKYKEERRRNAGIKPKRISIEKDGLKFCVICSEWKSATNEYFPLCRGRLGGHCKECHSKYYYDNHDENLDKMRLYYACNKEEINAKARIRYANDLSYRKYLNEYSVQYQKEHREEINSLARVRLLFKPRIKSEQERENDRLRAKKHYHDNKEEYNAFRRSDKGHARSTLQRVLNPSVYRAAKLRRRARVAALPDSFSDLDMKRCLEYWGNKCAISGVTKDIEYDHWIPITSPNCPGTIPTNMIPLTASLNRLKSSKEPIQWLISKFGEQEALVINAKIQGYFDWLRSL